MIYFFKYMIYERPNITIVEASADLLSASELGPGATDIGAPSFGAKESVWDEVNDNYNVKEEQDYGEDWN